MLTIFATPKPFRGHFDVIQRNAIRSWTLLRPACEVILFGDDEGTKAVAAEFSIRHIANVERNEYGTPLVSDLFKQAQQLSVHNLLCYVNSDIILMSDFTRAVQRVINHKRRFLLVGQRWNLNVNEELDFTQDWEKKLQAQISQNGQLEDSSGIDYFVFNRGLWDEIPPFAVGRPGWDNWMLYRARSLRAALIDATPVISAVHQNHDYSHHPHGADGVWKGAEAKRNLALLDHHGCTTEDATHLLTAEKLRLSRNLDTLSVLYPYLRLPVRVFSKALNVSRPIRSFLGLTASSRIKSTN